MKQHSLQGQRIMQEISTPQTSVILLALMIGLFCLPCFSQDSNKGKTDKEELLNQFVQSLGKNTIVFDASNIKQYWVDNSVSAQKDHFEICMNSSVNGTKSVPLKVQLANVDTTMDCKVTVISETKNFQFSVSIVNNNTVPVSLSTSEDNFIDLCVKSSRFHLEDTTNDYTFYLEFNSTTENFIIIKKIVFQFTKNESSIFQEWNQPIPEIDQEKTYKSSDFEEIGQTREIDLLKHSTGVDGTEKRTIYLPKGWNMEYDSKNPNPAPVVTLSDEKPLAGKRSILLDASHTAQLAGLYSNTYQSKPYRFSFYAKGIQSSKTRLQVQVRGVGKDGKIFLLKRMFYDLTQDKTYHISWDIKAYPSDVHYITVHFYVSNGSVLLDQFTIEHD